MMLGRYSDNMKENFKLLFCFKPGSWIESYIIKYNQLVGSYSTK